MAIWKFPGTIYDQDNNESWFKTSPVSAVSSNGRSARQMGNTVVITGGVHTPKKK